MSKKRNILMIINGKVYYSSLYEEERLRKFKKELEKFKIPKV